MAVSCRALGASQAWFFKWRKGDRSPGRKRRAALAAMIGYLFAQHHDTYRSPLNTSACAGLAVSKNIVAALMAEQNLVAPHTPGGAARPNRTSPRARRPDRLRRDFTPPALAGRAPVWRSHRNPHRREQTAAEWPRYWGCIRGAVRGHRGARRHRDGVVFHTDQGGAHTGNVFVDACRIRRSHRVQGTHRLSAGQRGLRSRQLQLNRPGKCGGS
jgi:putative transposase